MTSSSDRTAGFTLFEMLIAVAVAGFALALLGGLAGPPREGRQVTLAAREIALALRAARAMAVSENRPTGVSFDFARGIWQSDGAAGPLPGGVRVNVLSARGDMVAGSVPRIGFLPDGSSSGGRVTLDGHGRTVAVGVDWLSGRVALVELR
jgi:general secretion pathway protein H